MSEKTTSSEKSTATTRENAAANRGHQAGSLGRRGFLGAGALGSLGALSGAGLASSFATDLQERPQPWQPVSDRKIRVGIVGFGVCEFGARFGFQDHPNVEIVAVSDLIPERCQGLMKAVRCGKSYESLEKLVEDPEIEAVFVATDAPSHARHCIDALDRGKHVMTAVPAVFGSVEEAEKLVEAVERTGLKYMMAETSIFRADCHAMRKIYEADGFGRLVYSEGEYYHYTEKPIDSYQGWRIGMPPLWYPTHSTAYYVGVTGKRLTAVSCVGFRGTYPEYQPGGNRYENPFADEIALFETSEGGASRMIKARTVQRYVVETGRVFGEKGRMQGLDYTGYTKKDELPDISRPPLPPSVPAGGHGGSHGHLTHEFVSAILEDRAPLVNVYEALAMTVPGVIAHQSALRAGERLAVPRFDPPADG